MAKCPHCDYRLKIWDVFAECPKCKVNIPNYDWERRLEEDSAAAEAAFAKLRRKTTGMKYSFIGSKLRVARIPVSVLPLFSFLLPFFRVSFSLPFSESVRNFNLISLTNFLLGMELKNIPRMIQAPITGDAALRLFAAVAPVYIAFLTLFISLYFLLFNYRRFQSPGLFVMNLIAAVLLAVSASLFASFTGMVDASTVNAFTGNTGFGIYVSMFLFLASSVTNLMVARSAVDEDKLRKMLEKAEKKAAA